MPELSRLVASALKSSKPWLSENTNSNDTGISVITCDNQSFGIVCDVCSHIHSSSGEHIGSLLISTGSEV